MEEAGYDFQVVPPSDGAECGACSGESPEQFVARLAEQKARDVAVQLQNELQCQAIIGCDTVAECDGQILGKPTDERHAREMLRLLRGRDHRVLSGLCVLAKADRRKVVLSTNVAETSVTIEGITGVVDSGVARTLQFDAHVGLDRLQLTPISQASAQQRTGRAGRTEPGVCLRLWTGRAHRARAEHDEPEIGRLDLSGPVLQLKCSTGSIRARQARKRSITPMPAIATLRLGPSIDSLRVSTNGIASDSSI